MLDLILGLIIGFFVGWFHFSKKLNKAFILWLGPKEKFTQQDIIKKQKEFAFKTKNKYKVEVD